MRGDTCQRCGKVEGDDPLKKDTMYQASNVTFDGVAFNGMVCGQCYDKRD